MRRGFLLILSLLVPTTALGQEVGDVEITALGGWQYGGTQEYYNYTGYPSGDLHADANWNYGGALTFFPSPYNGIELQYTYQGTDLLLRPTGIEPFKITDLSTHYAHVYGIRVTPLGSPRAEGYVMGGLGATVYTTDIYEDRWLFSLGGGGGVRLNLNERVALRLQARMLVPIQFSSVGVYFGGAGGSVTVGGGSAIVQGDVSAGLTIKIGGRR
jgi:hypothetical protein